MKVVHAEALFRFENVTVVLQKGDEPRSRGEGLVTGRPR